MTAVRAGAQPNGFAADDTRDGGWAAALDAAGYPRVRREQARILVSDVAPLAVAENGGVLVTTGSSRVAQAVGVRERRDSVFVRRERDVHDTTQLILWREALRLPRFELPLAATVFS